MSWRKSVALLVVGLVLTQAGMLAVVGSSGAQSDGPSTDGGSNETPTESPDVTQTTQVTQPNAEFEIVSSSTDASIGGTGELTVVIENTGEDATEAAVNLKSESSSLTFGQSPSASQFIGEWNKNERKTITVEATVSPGASQSSKPITTTVSYTNPDGQPSRSASHRFGVTPAAEQSFDLSGTESSLRVGSDGSVTGTITNNGPSEATDAVLVPASNTSGITPQKSNVVLGDLGSGDSTEFDFPMAVKPGTETGDRQLSFVVQYQNDRGEITTSKPLNTEITVGSQQSQFQVIERSSNVSVGDEGTVALTLENTGEDATETVVNLRSLSPELALGQSGNATRFVGDWSAGARKTVAFQLQASNKTEQRSYPLSVSVTHTTDGTESNAAPVKIGITPNGEQSFSTANVRGNLSVGEEGTVTGTINNDGPNDIENAVVTLQVPENGKLKPQEIEYAIGQLDTNESKAFSFPIEVTDEASAGPRQLSFVLTYDNAGGEPRQSSVMNEQVTVAPDEDQFTVETGTVSVQADGTKEVTMTVTNNHEKSIRNIDAKAFVDDPLSVGNDKAFIEELGPNESANITFEVSASQSASPGSYPISVDFQYDVDGESELSNTYDVPIEVTPAEEEGVMSTLGTTPLSAALFLLVLLGGVGVWYWFRRRESDSRR